MNGIKVAVKIQNKTQEVEFTSIKNDQMTSGNIFVAQIGNGTKVHKTSMTMWIADSKDALVRLGYDRFNDQFVELADGRVGVLNRFPTIRNTGASIVGFAEDYVGTDVATKQNYYGGF
jgi:hypothetical protein